MRLLSATLAVGVVASVAAADLIEYAWAPGLVYDDQLDITWLQDANMAETMGLYQDGVMDWYDAHGFADAFVYATGGVVYQDWRLPEVWSLDVGPGVVDGEMGHLYADYGLTSDEPGPFLNLMGDDYWYDQEFDADNGLNFTFDPFFLGTYWNPKDSTEWSPRAMLVFNGAPVPSPGVLTIGAAGLVVLRRRR